MYSNGNSILINVLLTLFVIIFVIDEINAIQHTPKTKKKRKGIKGVYNFGKGNKHSDWKLLNDPSNQPVKITAFTADDKKELRKHPETRTKNILHMLAKLQQKTVDPTVKDIKQAKHVLGLYKVLKKKLKHAITKLRGVTPELPSEHRIHKDAAGILWTKANLKGGMAKLYKDREEDILRERKIMSYEDGTFKPGKNATKKGFVAESSKVLGHLPTHIPSRHGRHTTQPFCMPPGCNICIAPNCPGRKTPLAPHGVPEGLHSTNIKPTVQNHLKSKPTTAVDYKQVSRKFAASPQCPCGCPKLQCPCRCQGSQLFGNSNKPQIKHTLAKIAVVKNLPPTSAN